MRIAIQKDIDATAYLEMEKVSKQKHEFFYGNVFEMPGTTLRHAKLIKKFCNTIDPIITKIGYESYTTDLKVKVVKNDVFFYLDISIAKASFQ